MTDLHLYLAVGLPTIATLASLTVSLITTSDIRNDLRAETATRHSEFPKSAPLDAPKCRRFGLRCEKFGRI